MVTGTPYDSPSRPQVIDGTYLALPTVGPMTRAAIVVLAGGSGSRVGATDARGATLNKVYLPVAGRPLLAWSLDAAARTPGVARLILVVRADDAPTAHRLLAEYPCALPVEVVTGGDSRHRSEEAAVRHLALAIRAGELDVVAIHDGARPLADPALFAEVITTAAESGGAVPAVAAGPLVEATGPGGTSSGAHRQPVRLVRVQTPQAFRAAGLLDAFAAAARDGAEGTDTASTVEQFSDLVIQAVAGSATNLKVTYPADATVAEALLARRASA